MNTNLEAIVVRALKTFLQGVAGSLLTNLTNVTTLSAGKVALVGAFAAGVSALMNLYLQPNTK
jgi:hypothetical protein